MFLFRLCRGGQKTAVMVISYGISFTFIDVACMKSSSYFNSSWCWIVFYKYRSNSVFCAIMMIGVVQFVPSYDKVLFCL